MLFFQYTKETKNRLITNIDAFLFNMHKKGKRKKEEEVDLLLYTVV